MGGLPNSKVMKNGVRILFVGYTKRIKNYLVSAAFKQITLRNDR